MVRERLVSTALQERLCDLDVEMAHRLMTERRACRMLVEQRSQAVAVQAELQEERVRLRLCLELQENLCREQEERIRTLERTRTRSRLVGGGADGEEGGADGEPKAEAMRRVHAQRAALALAVVDRLDQPDAA